MSERSPVDTQEAPAVRPPRLPPLHWRRVVHGGRRFVLRQPVDITVEVRDGLWIHECAPLGIVAYAPTRAESLNAFRLDFAACWASVAQESDENLTEDARDLKRALLDLVEHVEE